MKTLLLFWALLTGKVLANDEVYHPPLIPAPQLKTPSVKPNLKKSALQREKSFRLSIGEEQERSPSSSKRTEATDEKTLPAWKYTPDEEDL